MHTRRASGTRGLEEDLMASPRVYPKGHIVYSVDNDYFSVGDGVRTYAQLPWYSGISNAPAPPPDDTPPGND